MKRLMAIDYGDRRIGIAVSDILLITAQPVGFITVNGKKDAVNQLREIYSQYDISKIVFGLPRNMDGTEGERAQIVRDFAKRLSEELVCEVDFFDERLTTVRADQTLNALNVKGRKKEGKKDSLSAALILQGYMAVHCK